MTVIRSERLNAERVTQLDPSMAAAFEGEIREVVRRDVSFARKPRAEIVSDPANEQVNALVRRVAAASMDEFDRVVIELQNVREMLRAEGERVEREIAGYGGLCHAAMTAMKIIGESLSQWKAPPRIQRGPQ
jgi:hypothetical protein